MTDLPRAVRDLRARFDGDARIKQTAIRVVDAAQDRCSGDLIVIDAKDESVVLSWSSVVPVVRVMFDRHVMEGVELDDAVLVVSRLLDGQFARETRGRRRHWGRIVVETDGGTTYASDWVG
jgi:hypothetical protein